MKRRHRLSGRSEWEPTTPEHLTPEMQEFIGSAVAGFRQIGFEVVLNARRPGGATGVLDAHQLLLLNRSTNDLATVVIVRTKATRTMVLALMSVFKDGRRINTGSRQQIGFVPPDPMSDKANFPAITDPALLWKAHGRRLEDARRSRDPRVAPAPGQEKEYLEAEHERELNRMVECGYFYRDKTSKDLRLTWKGAFLTTWKLQQPVRRWRTRLEERKGRRLWNELGLGDPAPPAGAANAPPIATAAVSDPRGATLGYDAALSPGEVRRSQDAGGVTIRIGTPTVLQILARRWVGLLYLAFIVSMLGLTAYRMWIFWKLARLMPRLYRTPLLSPFLCVWMVLLALEGWRLARSLARARGTVVIVASDDGLRYTNAIGRPHSGFISRSDFDKFMIIADVAAASGYWFRLEVRFRLRKPLALATGPSLPDLQSVVRELSTAMGLSAPEAVAASAPAM